ALGGAQELGLLPRILARMRQRRYPLLSNPVGEGQGTAGPICRARQGRDGDHLCRAARDVSLPRHGRDRARGARYGAPLPCPGGGKRTGSSLCTFAGLTATASDAGRQAVPLAAAFPASDEAAAPGRSARRQITTKSR